MISQLVGEMQDSSVKYIVVEGFQVYYEERIVELINLCFWLAPTREVVMRRKLKNKAMTLEKFEQKVWKRHLDYARIVYSRKVSMELYNLDATCGEAYVLKRRIA